MSADRNDNMAENTAATPYTPLPSNDPTATRLVKLSPAGFHDPVRCELETISLANEPSYIALSYVWGDPTDTVPVSLNGVEHGVTRNLDSFLRHLQALLKEIFLVLQCLPVHDWPSGLQIIEALNSLPTMEQNSENLTRTARAAVLSYFVSTNDHGSIRKINIEETSRTVKIAQWNDLSRPRFWIDALCINQSDLAERSEQVSRMSHIYRQTDLLFVWGLNHHQPEISEVLSGSVFCSIESLCRTLKRLSSETSPTTDDSNAANAVRSLFSIQESPVKLEFTEKITMLFELEWFCRAWVFQEVALSASKRSELWVGFKHMSLSRLLVIGTAVLRDAAELESNALVRTICERRASRVSRTLLALRMDKSLVDFGQNSLHSVHPASNLHICRRLIYMLSAGYLEFKVTDPRDAIYSLYGLLSSSRLPAMIEPDYTKSVSFVYHSVASFLLSQMGIGILGLLLSSLNGMNGCPSWVPDFACLQRYETLCQQYPSADMTYKLRVTDELLIIEEGPPHDRAVAPEFELYPSLLRISCPIYWLQTIETVVCIEGHWDYNQLNEAKSIDEFLLMRRQLNKAVSSGVLTSILNCTQCMDVSIWSKLLGRVIGDTFSPYPKELLGIGQVTCTNQNLGVSIGFDALYRPMAKRILHGCLGITQDGHLILGRRMNQLQKHDRIGFLPNSLETFIFRRCASGYQFITSCWQSDMEELVQVESLQLGDKEMITII